MSSKELDASDFFSLISKGQVVWVGNSSFPNTRNGKLCAPVFEKAIEVYNNKTEGDTARKNIPKIRVDATQIKGLPFVKVGGAVFTIEYVPHLKAVRIIAQNNKRPMLADAWSELVSSFDFGMRYKPANNNSNVAYILWADSKDPTTDRQERALIESA